MTTLLLQPDKLSLAVEFLNSGFPVAFPTETVFGLGADIFNTEACNSIFSIKERDRGKPLAAHVSSIEMALDVLDNPPEIFFRLAEKYLPGPLALISKKRKIVSDSITSGFDTLSIRFPSDPVCIKLISLFGRPIAATSANISGAESLSTSEEVFNVFDGKIPAVVAGKSSVGIESTVLALYPEPKILRVGAISREELEDFTGLHL